MFMPKLNGKDLPEKLVKMILKRTIQVHDEEKQKELMRKIPKDYIYVLDFYINKQKDLIEKLKAKKILYTPSTSLQKLKKEFESGEYDDFNTYMQTIEEAKQSIEKAQLVLADSGRAVSTPGPKKTRKVETRMSGKQGTLSNVLKTFQDGILVHAQSSSRAKEKLIFDSSFWLFDLGRADYTTLGRRSDVEIYLAKEPEVGYDSSTGKAIELYRGRLIKKAKTAERNLELETTFYTSLSGSKLKLNLDLMRSICEDNYRKRYGTNRDCTYDYIMERIFTDEFFKKVFSTAYMTREDILGRSRKIDAQVEKEWEFASELIEEEKKRQETRQSLRDDSIYRERFVRKDGSNISLFQIGSATISKREDKKAKERLGIYLFVDREADGQIINMGGFASNLNQHHIEDENTERQRAKRSYVADVFMDRKYLDLANHGDNLLYIGIQKAGAKNKGLGFSTGLISDRELESQISNLELTVLETIAGMNAMRYTTNKSELVMESRIEWLKARIEAESAKRKEKIAEDFAGDEEAPEI